MAKSRKYLWESFCIPDKMNAMKAPVPLFLILFLLMALFYGRPIVVGDGISYYALAVSLLRDHDFNLTNERRQFPEVMTRLNKTTGKQAPIYSCGFGIVYAPFLAATEGVAYVAPSLAEWQPYGQNARLPFVHALGIFTGSLFFGFFTVLWTYVLLTYKFKQHAWTSFLISVLLFIGTPLMFYVFVISSYSHAADAFLTATIFSLVFLDPATGWRIRVRNICLGIAMGLSVSLRNVNIVLILPAIGGVLFLQRHAGWKQNLTTLLEIFMGALPTLIVQIGYNLAQYGTIFATGYKVQLETSFLFEMLFHPWAGVFIWAPHHPSSNDRTCHGSIQTRFCFDFVADCNCSGDCDCFFPGKLVGRVLLRSKISYSPVYILGNRFVSIFSG